MVHDNLLKNLVTETAYRVIIDGNSRGDWVFDSGASRHMAPSSEGMINLREHQRAVQLADDCVVNSTHVGDIRIQLAHGHTLDLEDVLVVPKLSVH